MRDINCDKNRLGNLKKKIEMTEWMRRGESECVCVCVSGIAYVQRQWNTHITGLIWLCKLTANENNDNKNGDTTSHQPTERLHGTMWATAVTVVAIDATTTATIATAPASSSTSPGTTFISTSTIISLSPIIIMFHLY